MSGVCTFYFISLSLSLPLPLSPSLPLSLSLSLPPSLPPSLNPSLPPPSLPPSLSLSLSLSLSPSLSPSLPQWRVGRWIWGRWIWGVWSLVGRRVLSRPLQWVGFWVELPTIGRRVRRWRQPILLLSYLLWSVSTSSDHMTVT